MRIEIWWALLASKSREFWEFFREDVGRVFCGFRGGRWSRPRRAQPFGFRSVENPRENSFKRLIGQRLGRDPSTARTSSLCSLACFAQDDKSRVPLLGSLPWTPLHRKSPPFGKLRAGAPRENSFKRVIGQRLGRDPSTAHASSLCSLACFAQDDKSRVPLLGVSTLRLRCIENLHASASSGQGHPRENSFKRVRGQRLGRDPSTAHASSLCSLACFAQDDKSRVSLLGSPHPSTPFHRKSPLFGPAPGKLFENREGWGSPRLRRG